MRLLSLKIIIISHPIRWTRFSSRIRTLPASALGKGECCVRVFPFISVFDFDRTASYYNAEIDGKDVKDVAWLFSSSRITQLAHSWNNNRYYPEPKEKANKIKDYIAFYKVCLRPCAQRADTDSVSEQG